MSFHKGKRIKALDGGGVGKRIKSPEEYTFLQTNYNSISFFRWYKNLLFRSEVNKKQIYNYFIHALNYSIQDKMDSVLSEHDNINKNNHPVSIFCRTKVIIGQINQLGWNMVLLTLLNLAKIIKNYFVLSR